MGRLEKGTSDFLITTITAIVVAAIDASVILFPSYDYNRVVIVGIVTFFGLLIVSAHNEYAKKRAAGKKETNQSSEKPNKIPSAPTSLTALPGDTQISLSWKAPSDDSSIDGYYIYRGTTSGSEPTLIATKTSHSYVDKGLTNNTTYYYKILSYNSVGPSPQSAEAGATPMTGKGSDTGTGSDGQKGSAKWDGEIMRTSIAGTLILLYVIVIAANVFPTSYIYTCESGPDNKGSNSTSIASKNSNSNATANVVKESVACKSLLDNFGNVIIVVIGFYFGSKTAIQIYQNYKGSQASNSNSDKTANQNQK